jgi:hypothetical protein
VFMQTTLHPEVLAHDWVPPVPIARALEVAEVVRRLDPPCPRAPPPWIVGVAGAPGMGTSTVARVAAREVADRVRGTFAAPPPRILAVRTATSRGIHGVATALLRKLDEGFDGRGFPVAEILAGLLRRIRREARPVVLLLDDVGVGGPDLAPILRAIGDPDRFLPEGEAGIPPVWTILAGTGEALHSVERSAGDRCPIGPLVALRPYTDREIEAIVRDRVARALGPGGEVALAREIVRRTLEDGGGSSHALDLLRRRLVGIPVRSAGAFHESRTFGVTVEPHVLRALDAAAHDRSAPVGEVRRVAAELARAKGDRPLPATTLWRRIVQLERAGYVRREIRTGGTGGTRSILRLLAPVDEWVTVPSRPGSPRDVGSLGPVVEEERPEGVEAFGRGPAPWTTPDDPTD